MKQIKFSTAKQLAALLLLVGLASASCKKMLDINTDPNNYTDVPVTTLLPAAEVNLAFTLGGNASRYAGSFIQHYGGHRGQPVQYGQYNFDPSQSDNFWSSMYAGVLRDLRTIIDKSRVTGDSMYVGAAQILSAHTFSVLTDMYGDIPFTDALNGVGSITPKYDKQEDIYPALINLLTAGAANVKSGTGRKPGTDDVLYGSIAAAPAWGTAWEKAANSLKLRLLNHLSKVQPTAAQDFSVNKPFINFFQC
jgi:hypothetical protein